MPGRLLTISSHALRRASPTCMRQAIAKVSRYRAAVAEQLARRRARALAFLQDGLPVDHNPTVALATADPAPLVGGDVVQDLLRQRLQSIQVINDDVRCHAFPQGPAILEARRPGRQTA